jgi:hypothetical protein
VFYLELILLIVLAGLGLTVSAALVGKVFGSRPGPGERT